MLDHGEEGLEEDATTEGPGNLQQIMSPDRRGTLEG